MIPYQLMHGCNETQRTNREGMVMIMNRVIVQQAYDHRRNYHGVGPEGIVPSNF